VVAQNPQPCWYDTFECWYCYRGFCWTGQQGEFTYPGDLVYSGCSNMWWQCGGDEWFICWAFDGYVVSECPDGPTYYTGGYICCEEQM